MNTFSGGVVIGVLLCLSVPTLVIAVGLGALKLVATWGIRRDKRRGGAQ